MHRFYFLFLIQFLFVGKITAQNSFDKQHEKFIRLHRTADPDVLLQILQIEKKLIQKKQSGPSKSEKAELALDRGIYFYQINDYQKCLSAFQQAEKLAGLMVSRDQILLLTYLGVSYRNGLKDYQKSHLYLDKAIELAVKKKNNDLYALAVTLKTMTYYNQNQFRKGIRLLESFNKEKKPDLSIERKIAIHGILAQGYDKLGNSSQSYPHFTRAIELAKKTGDMKLMNLTHYAFLGYFIDKGRHSEAKVKALKLANLLKNKPGLDEELYDVYAVLGQIYSSLHQLDSALYYAELSHEYALKTGNVESLAITYGTLGMVYSDRNEEEKALRFMLKSLEYEEQIAGVKNLGVAYHNIGAVNLFLDNYPQAITYFKKAIQQAYLEGDIYSLNLTYTDLGEVYRESGNLKQALAMNDSVKLYSDSLNSIEAKKELLNLEVRYETKLKEQENKLLKLEVKKQNDLQRDMILLGIVVILLLLGMVYILFINNRLKKSKVAEAHAKIRNQKLEEELLNQRLNLLTEEINRKNQLIQSLENGANSFTEENLLNKVTLENDWLAFMTEFDKVHNGYLTELKHLFPTLSTNNLKLAALVKLEFSNKEIANILCITENGVKKAKQRLKERIR